MRLLLILPVLICSSIHAQQWAPLGATWHYEQGYAVAPGNYWGVITIVGDTIIQDKPCQILDNPVGQYQCYPFYPYIHYDGDSLWVYDQTAQQFSLLYCMNALPGDTWTTEITHSSGAYMDTIVWSVLDTSTVMIDGISLRQIEIEATDAYMLWPYCYPHCTVIERIGNLKYMFDFMIGVCDYETFLGLRCYEDDEISWLDPALSTCELIMSIEEATLVNGMRIMPSPARIGETITIEIDGPFHAQSELIVYDAIGRELERTMLNADRTTISFASNGLYFVYLAENGRITRWQRLVVN